VRCRSREAVVVVVGSPDDQVGEAVAVDVAGCDAKAELVGGRIAVEGKEDRTVNAGKHR
jgi:hypothetical protein